MITLWNDIRYAFRQLIKHPGFTVSVVLTLSIGIGANTAIFSVVNTVLFKPLPYDEPDRIVMIRQQKLKQGIKNMGASQRALAYWRQHNQVFENMASVGGRRFYVSGAEKSRHILAYTVSPNYFSVMGMKPMLGREFLPEEEHPGHEHVVILSYAFWREHMEGNPQAIGKSLILDNENYTVVGVMPAAFRDHLRRCTPFWVPKVLNPESRRAAGMVRARLKPGVTLAQAQAQMNVVEEQLVKMDPKFMTGYTVKLQSFLDAQLEESQFLLYLLWGGVGLVLLIACTNASGLFLIHGNVRQQEMAVRSALGASRGRIFRHLLVEGVVLSIIGGVIGVLLAYWAIRVLVRVAPVDIPRMKETRLDISVLFFALGVSVITGVILSLLPAWKASGIRLIHVLKQGRGSILRGRHSRRAHGSLVVAQIAIALTLIMAVAMLIQSFISMQNVDLGFKPTNVLVADIELPRIKYPKYNQWLNFYQQLLQRVQASPGVQSAAVISGGLDLSGGGSFGRFSIPGQPPIDPTERPMARSMTVSQDYFKTMGMPILKGRGFTDEDAQGGTSGIIIDENLARKYLGDVNPIGQQITYHQDQTGTIVGVVSTLKDYNELAPTINTIYVPMSRFCYLSSTIIVRAQGDSAGLTGMIRAQISSLDKDLEIRKIYTLSSELTEMLAPRRYTTILLGLFAQIALILAAVGLFGLLQYTVSQKGHEIGIRMALGATQAGITQTFLYQSVRLVMFGILVGLAGGFIVGRLMASLLYEASATDPVMLAITLSILIATALLASYIPARRAAKIDPMEALRYE